MSKECVLKDHSSEMFDFFNLDPIVHHLHDCLIRNQSLESFASDAPKDSCDSPSSSNLAAHVTHNPKHKKGQDLESKEKGGPPIARATHVLVEGMTPCVGNT